MSANTGRLSDAIERLLPLVIVAAIVAFAYFWFIRAPLNVYLRTRPDSAALQDRLKTAQDRLARASGTPRVDVQTPLDLFEKQMSTDDKVAEMTTLLAKAVIDSTPPDKLRGFVIETSDRIKVGGDDGGRGGPPMARAMPSQVGSAPDLRLALFPYIVTYTPIKVSFSSTFEGIGNFMWKVRDFPTTVEVRSSTLTRGMPLMKMELLIWVYQRGAAIGQPLLTPAPGTPGGIRPNPVVPRVAQLTGAEG